MQPLDELFEELVMNIQAREPIREAGGQFAENAQDEQGHHSRNEDRGFGLRGEIVEKVLENERFGGIDAGECQGEEEDDENGLAERRRKANRPPQAGKASPFIPQLT